MSNLPAPANPLDAFVFGQSTVLHESWPHKCEGSGVTRADTAFVISLISAAVAAISLMWQLALFHLSGARLEVRLVPAVLMAIRGSVVKGPDRGWGKDLPDEMDGAMDPYWVDLALVRAVNVGRTAMSVTDIGLDFGGSQRRKFWQRHTVSLSPVPIHDGAKDLTEVRLEPGEVVNAFMDCWPTFEYARGHHRRLRVRATARAAGRRSTRSKWRKRWRIDNSQYKLWPHGEATAELRAFQAVWRGFYSDDPATAMLPWFRVQPLLKDDQEPTLDELRKALGGNGDDGIGAGRAAIVAANVVGALRQGGKA